MSSRSRLFATCLTIACLGAGAAASAAHAVPAPAWEPIAASGPTNLPPLQSEVQRLSVDAEGGIYSLTATLAKGSGTLTRVSSFGLFAKGDTELTFFFVFGGAFEVGQNVSGYGIADGTTIVDVSPDGLTITLSQPTEEEGSFTEVVASSKTVSNVAVESGSFEVGQAISGIGLAPGTTIEAVDSESETLTLSEYPTAGGAQLLTASATSGPIDFDAPASELEAELNSLPGLTVTVNGGPGGKGAKNPYFVAFGGSLSDVDVAELSADGSGLTGGDTHAALVTTAVPGGPGTTTIVIYPQNVGGAPSSGTTTLTFGLPAGVETTAAPKGGPSADEWSCSPAGAGQAGASCTMSNVATPGVTLPPLRVPVTAGAGANSGNVHIEVSGGGTVGTAVYDMPLIVSAVPAPPGLQSVTAAPYKDDGTVDTRAGAHPYSASTGILVNTVRTPFGFIVPSGEPRDILVDTPPGFFGNPLAADRCSEAAEQEDCPQTSMVATAQVPLARGELFNSPVSSGGEFGELSPVSNIEAPFGYPAKLRFTTGLNQVLVNVVASLRSDEDYGLKIGSYDTPQIKTVHGAFFTIWGTPTAAGHDDQRCSSFDKGPESGEEPVGKDCVTREEILEEGGEEVAFLTNPVDCSEEALRVPQATLNLNTWQNPGQLFSSTVPLEPVEGCDDLDFDAGFSFQPGTDRADSPASFETELTTPSEGLLDPEGRTNPTIKQTVIDLPDGVVLNASAADGLEVCSEEEIGLKGTGFARPNEIRFTKEPNECPDASKIGTGELKSSLIAETLQADLFLAAQGEGNPFGSLFAIYLVIENPRNGIFIKLPGEVQVDEGTGRQRIVFKDLPPLPFDYLKLKLKGGDRSPLATPSTCGEYTTTATNTPWSAPESGPPLVSSSAFAISRGSGGGNCASSPGGRPFGVGLSAGTDVPQAGAHSPLAFQITRPDGAQELDTLELSPPAGLAAKLKGVPYCSEEQIASANARVSGKAEQSSPSCPAASKVGRTLSGAGSGPRPFYAPGELYLAGPYKDAPLSVVAITPAVAGPFDLGNVVVRSALHVDPATAQVTAKTDPLPKIVKGVPLRIRDLRVILDRENFTLNPTDCSEKQITARVGGSSGAVTELANRFQVGNCNALGFKPKTRLQLFGGVKRGRYQGVRAVVRPRPGDANISRTVVRFPKSAFVAQEHIRTVCTRVQFAADNCPKGSIYGKAIAYSPLLDEPLKGNVYLRSSDNDLPDAVADLRGPASQPIRVEVAVRNDSVRGALRNTVLAAPDVPVSYFRLQMFGGKKGLIINSRNICRGRNVARVAMAAHNGRRSVEHVNVFNRKCKKFKRAAKRRAKAKRTAHRAKIAATRR